MTEIGTYVHLYTLNTWVGVTGNERNHGFWSNASAGTGTWPGSGAG